MLHSRKATVKIKGKAWGNSFESLTSSAINIDAFKREKKNKLLDYIKNLGAMIYF